MKQLTRRQLLNDLAACRNHREMDQREIENLRQQVLTAASDTRMLHSNIARLTEEAADWRFAHRTICRLVDKR